jgi:hypothetical protein
MIKVHNTTDDDHHSEISQSSVNAFQKCGGLGLDLGLNSRNFTFLYFSASIIKCLSGSLKFVFTSIL